MLPGRKKHIHGYTHRHTYKYTDTHKYTQRHTLIHIETHINTQKHTNNRDTYTEIHRHTYRYRPLGTHRDTQRLYKHTLTHMKICTRHTDTHRHT